MKWTIGLFAAAAIVAAAAWFILVGTSLSPFTPARTPPPQGFDPAAFPELAAMSSTAQATVSVPGDGSEYREHYTIPALGVTYFILSNPDGTRRVIFVNADGEVIADITDQPQLFPMGEYFVALDGYYTVSAQAVSARKPIIETEVASEQALEAMIAESSHYRSYTATELPSNDLAQGINNSLHVMRHDGVWKSVLSEDQRYYDWKVPEFHRLDAQYRVARRGDTRRHQKVFDGRYRVELTHFDQIEYVPERGAMIGSTTGKGRAARWVGTGYYTVFIDDDPALRFRIEDDREFLSPYGPAYLIILGGAGKEFIVIEHRNHLNARQVVVVSAASE